MKKIARLIECAHEPTRFETFLKDETFPMIEDGKATFVFRHHDASQVNVRHWVYGLPSSQPCHRIADTSVWYATLEMPEGSRVEYKFEVMVGDQCEWVRDPLNPHEARDPFGANSVCQGEGYKRPIWTQTDPDARQGTLQHHVLRDTPTGDQAIQVYLPARMNPNRRYRLLVVHDGEDYLRYANLKVVLDNLIHQLDMAPVIAVMTSSSDRLHEYPDHEPHARFISEHLVPWAETSYPLYGTRRSRCLMGASFGAVASLSAAWRYPDLFGRLLLQSGSFAFTDIGEQRRGPAFDPVVKFINDFRNAPGVPSSKVYMSCGMYESLIYENRSMYPFLQKAGMDVRFTEARDGHNWENWRDRLREGLSWLFPGPQWMYYE